MKNFAVFISLFLISGCSFFNKKTVELGINSSPQGANIYINQKYFGTTPKVVNIEPKEYIVSLDLAGYGNTSFKTPIFTGSIRTKADNSINADGVRCLLDLVSVLFSFQAYTGKCADFKQKQYNITIPKVDMANTFQSQETYGHILKNDHDVLRANSNPENLINYYYK
jgi:ribosomal protein L21E